MARLYRVNIYGLVALSITIKRNERIISAPRAKNIGRQKFKIFKSKIFSAN